MENRAISDSSGFRRRARRHEQTLYHNYEYDRFIPPLRVTVAGVSRFSEGDYFKNVNRKFFSMNLIALGTANWEQNGMSGVLAPGDIFLAHVGKNQYFTSGPAGYVHKRFIIADGPALDTILRATGLLDLNWVRPADPAQITSLFRQAYRTMALKPDDFVLKLSLLLHEILFVLGRSIASDYPASIRHAIEFMRRNLNADLDLKTICQEISLSVRQGTRLFRKYLNMSPVQFFINLKMELARNLALDTAMSIKQIALTLGYKDPLYFSQQFKKRFGCSPRKFRSEASFDQ